MTDSNAADDNWLLDEDEEEAPAAGLPAPDQRLWRVLIVDDDVDVHAVTRLALRNVSFKGRELELFSAYSGREAYDILRDTPDIALVLLDVVMETDDAGLLLARRIREELHNAIVGFHDHIQQHQRNVRRIAQDVERLAAAIRRIQFQLAPLEAHIA